MLLFLFLSLRPVNFNGIKSIGCAIDWRTAAAGSAGEWLISFVFNRGQKVY